MSVKVSDDSDVVSYKARCPKCALAGKDTARDNLAVYRDGHTHCFGCGFRTPSPMEVRLRALAEPLPAITKNNPNDNYDFPEDCVLDIPKDPMDWLKSFTITNDEIKKHRFMWSPSMEMLIFAALDKDNKVCMWQGRNFKKYPFDKPKYLTKGPKSGIIYKAGLENNKDKAVIITEDLLSAIKVGRIYQSVPLFGSSVPLEMVRTLAKQYDILGIWLDSDKRIEAVKQALRASQYMPTFVVESQLDPKAYHLEAITELIDMAAKQAAFKDQLPAGTTIYEAQPALTEVDEDHLPNPGQNENYTTYLHRTKLNSVQYPYATFAKVKNRLYSIRRQKIGVIQPMSNFYHEEFPTSSDKCDPEPGEQYMDWRERHNAPDTPAAIEEYNRRLTGLREIMQEAMRHDYDVNNRRFKE